MFETHGIFFRIYRLSQVSTYTALAFSLIRNAEISKNGVLKRWQIMNDLPNLKQEVFFPKKENISKPIGD
jgi:hypothetical protein